MKRDTHTKKREKKKKRSVLNMRSCTTFTQMPCSLSSSVYFDQFFNDAPYKLEFLSLDGTNSNGKSVENGGKMIELPTFTDQVQSEFGTK